MMINSVSDVVASVEETLWEAEDNEVDRHDVAGALERLAGEVRAGYPKLPENRGAWQQSARSDNGGSTAGDSDPRPSIERVSTHKTEERDPLPSAVEILADVDRPGVCYIYRGIELRKHSDIAAVWWVHQADTGRLVDAINSDAYETATNLLDALDALAYEHGANNGGEA